jgi:hypothetical protein
MEFIPADLLNLAPLLSAERTKSSVLHLLNGFDYFVWCGFDRPDSVAMNSRNLRSFANDWAFGWYLPASQSQMVAFTTPMRAAIALVGSQLRSKYSLNSRSVVFVSGSVIGLSKLWYRSSLVAV